MGRPVSDLPEFVRDLLRRAEASYPDRAHRLWEIWEGAVGSDLARRSQPIEFRRGTLTVAVENASWLQQLSFLREQIRAALNRELGQEIVKQVRLRNMPLERLPPPRGPAAPPPWLAERLDPEFLRVVEEEVSPVADPALQEQLRRVRVRAEQARRHLSRPADPQPPGNTSGSRRGG